MSPGTLFGEAGSGFMRMNIGAPRNVIEAALSKISGKRDNRMSWVGSGLTYLEIDL